MFSKSCCTKGTQTSPESRNPAHRQSRTASESGDLESAACGLRPPRAYPPQRSYGRVAEGGGLLNLRAPYPPVPLSLIVYVFVDVLAFGCPNSSRLKTPST